MKLAEAYFKATNRWERQRSEISAAEETLRSSESAAMMHPSTTANGQVEKAKRCLADAKAAEQIARWDVEFLICRSGLKPQDEVVGWTDRAGRTNG
jgi:hypothetical protein